MGTEVDQSAVHELLIQQVIEIGVTQLESPLTEGELAAGKTLEQSSALDQASARPARQYKRECKPKLVDALGFMYNVKRTRPKGVTDWQCTLRGRSMACRATVKQKMCSFVPGPQPHLHMAESQIDVIDSKNKNRGRKSKGQKKTKKTAKMTKTMLAAMKAELHDAKTKTEKKAQSVVKYHKPRLVDKRNGFTYSIKCFRGEATLWRCVLRNTKWKCPAVLKQQKGQFIFGSKPHSHEGGTEKETVTETASKAERKGKKSIAEHAWDIATATCMDSTQTGTTRLSEEAIAAGYRFMRSSSQRSRPRLIDGQGYTYNIKRVRRLNTDWQCTVRNKKMFCPVTLKECDGVITPGRHRHIHAPEPGAAVKATVMSEIKARALENLFQPTTRIVNEVLTQQVSEEPTVAILKPTNLARMAHRAREAKKQKYINSVLYGLAQFHPGDSWPNGEGSDDNDDSGSDDGSDTNNK